MHGGAVHAHRFSAGQHVRNVSACTQMTACEEREACTQIQCRAACEERACKRRTTNKQGA